MLALELNDVVVRLLSVVMNPRNLTLASVKEKPALGVVDATVVDLDNGWRRGTDTLTVVPTC